MSPVTPEGTECPAQLLDLYLYSVGLRSIRFWFAHCFPERIGSGNSLSAISCKPVHAKIAQELVPCQTARLTWMTNSL